jgi:PAS domain S-box-containing protein
MNIASHSLPIVPEFARNALETIVAQIGSAVSRLNAEKALNESEEQYRTLFANSPASITILDDSGVIVDCNKATEVLIGYSKSVIIGKSFGELMTLNPDDLPVLMEKFELLLQGQDISPYELEITQKNVEKRWININTSRLVKDEKLMGFQVIAIDNTERKFAEDALKQSQERFRDLVDLLPEAVFETNLDGNITFANQKAFELSGYEEKDANIGLNSLQVLIPEDRDRALSNIRQILKGKNLGVNEYTGLHKDGSTFPVLIHTTAIIQNGKPMGIRGIIIDITERKLLEEELKNKLRETEHLFQLSESLKYSDSIDDACRKGLISICAGFEFSRGLLFQMDRNEETLALTHSFGMDKKNVKIDISKLSNQNILYQVIMANHWFIVNKGKIGPTDEKVKLPQVFGEKLEFPTNKDSFILAPINSKTRTMGLVALELTTQKSFSEESPEMLEMYFSTLGIALDNAQLYHKLEKSYNKLKKLDKLKNEFIDVASHELRTPLASIKIYTDLMRDGFIGKFSSDEQSQLEDMNNNIKNLNNLIHDMLDFTRTEDDFFKITPDKMVMIDLVEETADKFRQIAETRKIGVKVKSSGDTTAYSDINMMKKVLNNLINNAIKYSHDGKEIIVKVADAGEFTMVEVKDEGIGISKKDLPNIFERFYMGDTSLTRERDQLGLGLSIARSIVEQHGGTIWAESELGKGSVFRFTIPKRIQRVKNKKTGSKLGTRQNNRNRTKKSKKAKNKKNTKNTKKTNKTKQAGS